MATETPAAKVVRILGAKRIAAACDLSTNAVWKWATSGGGTIPSRHQGTVLALARELEKPLTAADLIRVDEAA